MGELLTSNWRFLLKKFWAVLVYLSVPEGTSSYKLSFSIFCKTENMASKFIDLSSSTPSCSGFANERLLLQIRHVPGRPVNSQAIPCQVYLKTCWTCLSRSRADIF